MIKHKIVEAADDRLCAECHQVWHGICRAFTVPHSEEEAEYRKEGWASCLGGWKGENAEDR